MSGHMPGELPKSTSDDTHLADDSKRPENAAGSSGYASPVQEGGHKQKYKKLRNDVESAFTNTEAGIQVLLISEFGNMFDSIDRILACGVTQPTGRKVKCTRELFEDSLANINLPHIHVVADPPYVALIDSECWRVKHRETVVAAEKTTKPLCSTYSSDLHPAA